MIIRRIILFRPAIWEGTHAIGARPSTNVGYVYPQTQACMHPIDVPMIRRR